MLTRKPIFPGIIELNFQAGEVLGCNVYLVHNADREMTIEMEDDALTMTGRTFLDLNEFLDKIDAGLEPNSE